MMQKINMDEIQLNPLLMHFAILIHFGGIPGLRSMSLLPLENQGPFVCVNHAPAIRGKIIEIKVACHCSVAKGGAKKFFC